MVKFEVFMMGLLVSSTVTGLVTEATKKILAEYNKSYKSNTIAGIAATIVSAAICAGYILTTNTVFTAQVGVCVVSQIFMSWLCAMVGYDKVIQTISQFKTTESE